MILKAKSFAKKSAAIKNTDFRVLNVLESPIEGLFDKIVIVTVLGEIPRVEGVILKLHDLLNDEGIVSVTEVIPDPCYITQKKLEKLFDAHGFKKVETFSGLMSYTMNFTKK